MNSVKLLYLCATRELYFLFFSFLTLIPFDSLNHTQTQKKKQFCDENYCIFFLHTSSTIIVHTVALMLMSQWWMFDIWTILRAHISFLWFISIQSVHNSKNKWWFPRCKLKTIIFAYHLNKTMLLQTICMPHTWNVQARTRKYLWQYEFQFWSEERNEWLNE